MKKLYILILILFFGKISFSQNSYKVITIRNPYFYQDIGIGWHPTTTLYPINQSIGSTSTMVTSKGGFTATQTFVLPSYVDTSAANSNNPYTSSYSSSIIWSTYDSSIYVLKKSVSGTYWFKAAGSGGGATGNFWSIYGNYIPVTPANLGIGLNDPFNVLNFRTNNTNWMTLDLTGRLGINLSSGIIGKLHIRTDGIDTTQTDSTGIYLENSTAANSSVKQQMSPAIIWKGQAWKNTGSLNQTHLWKADVLPYNSTILPTSSDWRLSVNTAGGGYNNVVKVSSGGFMKIFIPGSTTYGSVNGVSFGDITSGIYFGQTIPSSATGLYNTSIGKTTLQYLTSGSYNTNLGFGTLYNDTSGSTNTAVGYYSLYANKSGYSNTAIGVNSGVNNTIGFQNSFLGAGAGENHTTGDGNTFVGYDAGLNSTDSYYNTYTGWNSKGGSNGVGNSLYGYQSGTTLAAGNTYNVAMGYQAMYHASQKTDAAKSIALGFNAYTTASNQLSISDSITRFTFPGVSRGVANYVLTDSLGDGQYWVGRPLSAIGIPISSLTAATGTNGINNAGYNQNWTWNSLTGIAFSIGTVSTTAASNGQIMFDVSMSGTNANSTQTTRGINILNQHDGTGSTNIGIKSVVNNGNTNIAAWFESTGSNSSAIIVPSGGGNVGIGTSTPDSLLQVYLGAHFSRGIKAENLPTFADTTNFKPIVVNTTGTAGTIGTVYKATYWPGGGGGTPAGNFGNIQLNRNGAFATPGSDSLDFESATGLSVKGAIRAHTGIIQGNSDPTTFTMTGQSGTYSMNITYDNSANFRMSHQGGYQFWQDGGIALFDLTAGAAIFNLSGRNYDFQVEGDNDANMIYGDASADKVGIGTASPTTKLQVAGTFAAEQGADVASANNLAVISNSVEITGTTQINLISNTGWVNGSLIHLIFSTTPTVKNGQTTSGSNITILLAGAADFAATANDILTLMLCEVGGTQAWREVSRSVN